MSEYALGVFSGLCAWFLVETVFTVRDLGEEIELTPHKVMMNLIMVGITLFGVLWHL